MNIQDDSKSQADVTFDDLEIGVFFTLGPSGDLRFKIRHTYGLNNVNVTCGVLNHINVKRRVFPVEMVPKA